MGVAGLHYNLPELVGVAIAARFYMTDTPEEDIIAGLSLASMS